MSYFLRELCAIHKPGKVAVTADVILKAAKIASDRAEILHSILKNSLAELEFSVIAERTVRLEKTRALRESSFDTDTYLKNNKMDIPEGGDDFRGEEPGPGGISRDDPMLSWTSLHQAAGLREVN